MKATALVSALLLSASPALAHDWTGPYFGVVGGWATGEQAGRTVYTDESGAYDLGGGTIDLDGGVVGGTLGFQKQVGLLVLGIEGDISYADVEGTGVFDLPGGYRWTLKSSVDSFATLRGRIGFTAGPILFYGTGGAAWASLDTDEVVTVTTAEQGFEPGTTTVRASGSDDLFGWVAGAGAEIDLSRGWSLKAEWLHIDLGDTDMKFSGTAYPDSEAPIANYRNDSFPSDVRFDVYRVGLNYRF